MTHTSWPCAGTQGPLQNVLAVPGSLQTSAGIWALSVRWPVKWYRFQFSFWTASLGPWTSTFSGTSELGKASSPGSSCAGTLPPAWHLGDFRGRSPETPQEAPVPIQVGFHVVHVFVAWSLLFWFFLTSAVLKNPPIKQGCLE